MKVEPRDKIEEKSKKRSKSVSTDLNHTAEEDVRRVKFKEEEEDSADLGAEFMAIGEAKAKKLRAVGGMILYIAHMRNTTRFSI